MGSRAWRATNRKLTVVDTDIVVALVAGLFLLVSATVGLIGTLAGRSEPRMAKELLALNEIIGGMDPGKARAALESRRDRAALAYGSRGETPSVFPFAAFAFFGGYAAIVVGGLTLRGDPDGWSSLYENLLAGLILSGAGAVVIGILAALLGLVGVVVNWRRNREVSPRIPEPASAEVEESLTS